MKKGVCIKILAVIFFIIVIGVITFFAVPRLTLIDSDVKVLLEEDYKEPGYKAKSLWFDISNKVVVTNIDNTKVGNYEVEYKLNNKTIKRNVKVIETVEPEIKLEGDETSYVCPGGKYEEAGYTASDNYDGDLTEKVTKEEKEDMIIYTVSDSSENTKSVERKLVYEDVTDPVIELKGGNTLTLKLGSSYSDPGYTASDNCLGDITDRVEVSGSVNTNKAGTYKITYKVSDGVHEVSVVRSISIVSGVATLGTENSPGVIYLTFDDGPSSKYTRIILDTLKKYNVKATFFVVPKDSSLYYLIKEEYNSGHSIAIHSSSHTYSIVYASDSNFQNDVLKTNETIKSLTGSYTHLYRFPGGSSNTVSKNYSKGIVTRMASWLHENGYHYFDWNISSGDAAGGSPTSTQIANNVINALSKSRANVVLMHDTHDYTAYAVERIITYGIENGYTFAPITMNTKEVHHSIAN